MNIGALSYVHKEFKPLYYLTYDVMDIPHYNYRTGSLEKDGAFEIENGYVENGFFRSWLLDLSDVK